MIKRWATQTFEPQNQFMRDQMNIEHDLSFIETEELVKELEKRSPAGSVILLAKEARNMDGDDIWVSLHGSQFMNLGLLEIARQRILSTLLDEDGKET